MDRRKFLVRGTLAAGGAAAVTQAIAQAPALPQIRWRCASSFPKSLDTIYGGGEVVAKRVEQLTGGKFQIRVFAAGEIVPAFGVVDAIQQGTIECAHTASYYFVGKNKAFAFDTTLPFGLNQRQQNAWIYYGGGLELMREFFKDFGIISFPAGNTGVQMGGWWRKEVKTVNDLKGAKMRIAGLGGEVMARLGAVPQQIAGGDIYPALERGAIDSAEWVGPYDDEKLGFYKVAPHYYFPGWWEGTLQVSLYVNEGMYNDLPKGYQAAIAQASALASNEMIAKYDAENPAALRRLISQGAQLKAFPKPVMDACHAEALKVYAEMSAKSAAFKKVHDNYMAFRDNMLPWFRVADGSFDQYMASTRR